MTTQDRISNFLRAANSAGDLLSFAKLRDADLMIVVVSQVMEDLKVLRRDLAAQVTAERNKRTQRGE